jgi:hypothetical protein
MAGSSALRLQTDEVHVHVHTGFIVVVVASSAASCSDFPARAVVVVGYKEEEVFCVRKPFLADQISYFRRHPATAADLHPPPSGPPFHTRQEQSRRLRSTGFQNVENVQITPEHCTADNLRCVNPGTGNTGGKHSS